ncbi:cyclopropane-fatty-acyl-phospholipid synthase [Herbihabitans rhizosphaerae]|uniref:Cyclopropane-fatty-acyl-phospholipid synthase n=1 Tax=Herbihabitans rhizosphaerae TaxID=1872711 RepID=A0A4Q7KIZ7_9PSEU|nr:cyclopropane-fatty-acyl-phospholipid synthase family protein [Herbihabitans rhizosphaerae]RZS36538.1 cyclopropane-fatty-acyl-phospholipid synthase [Herbihabitans rhizosphaerae]
MRLAEQFLQMIGEDADLEVRAYDGSRAGPPDAPAGFTVRSPIALSYVASAPGELGLARAYVSGALEITGDPHAALIEVEKSTVDSLTWTDKMRLVARMGAARVWWPVRRPALEQRLHGRRHSKARDRKAIAHHYDVSNKFYADVLGPSMAYTCAVYDHEDATLEEAQFAKHDLVARKLGLGEGMRLLDVGCGWGGMVMHAAEHYGVRALGVTLSRRQAEWAQKAIAERGLSDLAEVRHLDYRDVPETGFDAISSIGLTEHIGKANLPGYFAFLYGKLRTGGRLLNHCITRPDNAAPARVGGFLNHYVFPDGELVSPGAIVSLAHDAGFEVRHLENLREHYAKTLTAWCANLDERWDAAVREVGPARARVWRLYLAGSRVGFERNTVQLHQVLGVKLDGMDAHMPLRPNWLS